MTWILFYILDAAGPYLTPLERRINDAYARKHDQDLGHFESNFSNFTLTILRYEKSLREPVESGNVVLGR